MIFLKKEGSCEDNVCSAPEQQLDATVQPTALFLHAARLLRWVDGQVGRLVLLAAAALLLVAALRLVAALAVLAAGALALAELLPGEDGDGRDGGNTDDGDGNLLGVLLLARPVPGKTFGLLRTLGWCG